MLAAGRVAVLDAQPFAAIAVDQVEARGAEAHRGRRGVTGFHVIDQRGLVHRLAVDQRATVIVQHEVHFAAVGQIRHTKMRGPYSQHNVIVRCAADTVGTILQPLQTGQAQPSARCRQPLETAGAPLLHTLLVTVGIGGMHGGDSHNGGGNKEAGTDHRSLQQNDYRMARINGHA